MFNHYVYSMRVASGGSMRAYMAGEALRIGDPAGMREVCRMAGGAYTGRVVWDDRRPRLDRYTEQNQLDAIKALGKSGKQEALDWLRNVSEERTRTGTDYGRLHHLDASVPLNAGTPVAEYVTHPDAGRGLRRLLDYSVGLNSLGTAGDGKQAFVMHSESEMASRKADVVEDSPAHQALLKAIGNLETSVAFGRLHGLTGFWE